MAMSLAAGEVVSGVGVEESATLWVEDTVEAGDEHVGRDVGTQSFIDSFEYLTRREGAQRLSSDPQHAAGGGHHKRRGHALARSVSHDHSQPALREVVEVVEVAAYLPGRPVVVGDLP